jgi:hypothetical protein
MFISLLIADILLVYRFLQSSNLCNPVVVIFKIVNYLGLLLVDNLNDSRDVNLNPTFLDVSQCIGHNFSQVFRDHALRGRPTLCSLLKQIVGKRASLELFSPLSKILKSFMEGIRS